MIAEVLAGRGTSALVVRGDDGLDELTTTTTSTVWVVGGGEVRARDPRPGRARLARGHPGRPARRRRRRSTPRCSARCSAGEPGPVRDAVLLNAAGALVAFDGDRRPRDWPTRCRRRSSGRRPAVDSGAAQRAARRAGWSLDRRCGADCC